MKNIKKTMTIMMVIVFTLFNLNVVLIEHFIDQYFAKTLIASVVIWAIVALLMNGLFLLGDTLPRKKNRGR